MECRFWILNDARTNRMNHPSSDKKTSKAIYRHSAARCLLCLAIFCKRDLNPI